MRSPRTPLATLKPAKDKSTERIDGIVALIMTIGRALVAQEELQPEYCMFFCDSQGCPSVLSLDMPQHHQLHVQSNPLPI